MKKTILMTTAAMTMLAIPAQAEEIKFKPYLGFDLQRMAVSYDNNLDDALEDTLNGGNVHAGVRFGKYMGLELGYFRTLEGKQDVNYNLAALTGTPGDVVSSTKVRTQGLTLDAMGYLPVTDRLDLIGTAGISWTKADLQVGGIAYGTTGTIEDDDSKFGFRVGAGAQYSLTDQLNVRGLVRYQDMGFKISGFDAAEGAWVYTLGLNYSF